VVRSIIAAAWWGRALASDRPLRFLLAIGLASTSAACVLDWASLRSDGKTVAGEDAADAGDTEEEIDGDASNADTRDEKASCSEDVLVINELQASGAAGPADEFVEIHNPATCDVRLEGFTLRYSSFAGSTPFIQWTGSASDAVAPGAYVVVGGSTYPGGVMGRFGTDAGAGTLAADGGGIGLFNSGGKVIDSVAYGTINPGHPLVRPAGGKAAPTPPTGQSIARIPDGHDTETNETDFVIAPSPTPAARN
jgi:Lamin Tail Domain